LEEESEDAWTLRGKNEEKLATGRRRRDPRVGRASAAGRRGARLRRVSGVVARDSRVGARARRVARVRGPEISRTLSALISLAEV